MTLSELEAYVARHGEKHGFTVRSFQTNHEGELIEKVHQLVVDRADAAIINPGAWTHYSYALPTPWSSSRPRWLRCTSPTSSGARSGDAHR